MNSYNLSVCVAPSFLNSAFTYLIGDVNARKASELLRFLIDEYNQTKTNIDTHFLLNISFRAVGIFGHEMFTLLGESPNLNCSNIDQSKDHQDIDIKRN